MSTKYTYSVSKDFSKGQVSSDRLTLEIRASAITIALDYISTSGDACDIWFKADLPKDDVTALAAVVSVHSGEPLPAAALDDQGHPVVRLYGDTGVGIPSVQVLNIPDAAKNLMKSWLVVAPPLTIENFDVLIGDDLVGPMGRCFIAGGEYRCRTAAVEGSALHLAIVDRDDFLGYFAYFGMSKTKLQGLTGQTGNFVVGNTVTGETSGKTSKVLAVNGDVEITFGQGPFQAGEVVTFKDGAGTTTATATLGTWHEGDVIEILRSVKDEWIEGLDQRTVEPGGSKELPAGLYLRTIVYNASPTDVLKVKISFIVGTQ